MRDEARRIWNSLGKKGQTPERWGDADLVVRSYYAGEMRRFFPELHLCELDYKSHRIAINIYPAWHAKWVAETSPPALKRSASQAPEGEPAKKYRGRKKANQSSSADDLLPPADQTSALSASGVPTSSSLSALSSAPPQVLAPTPVSIAPSPSVISAPQPSHSSLPPPAPPLVSPPQSSVVPSPTVDLSAVTVAVKKNIPIQMEVDNDLPIVPASSPSTSTLAATAAGPSTSAPATTAVGAGPAVGVVDNPLAFLGDTTAPTTRADFIADVAKTKAGKSKKDAKADQVKYVRPNKTKSARNLCLIDYMEKNNIPLPGKVQSDVFDQYYSGLTKDQKKAWADKSKEEKKDKTKDT
ncbi:hypothetical protein K438DRAFT_1949111 [Mycena galopus ATCC 62051]|nr:hypothetical protein K438DRAFT_1949111 [Mycena galopus ATCC 62051]